MLRWSTYQGETLFGDPDANAGGTPVPLLAVGVAVDLNQPWTQYRSLRIRYLLPGNAAVMSASVATGQIEPGGAGTIAVATASEGPPLVRMIFSYGDATARSIVIGITNGTPWTLLSIEGVNPEIGAFERTYASTAELPSPSRLPLGTRAKVVGRTRPFEVMEFMVTDGVAMHFGLGNRRWLCVGGQSRDLLAGNQLIAAANTFVGTGWNIPLLFPTLLFDFGAQTAGGVRSGAWHRVLMDDLCPAPTIIGLADAGDLATAANSMQVEERGVLYSIGCERGSGNLLIATDDPTKDVLPLRVRGAG